MYIHWTDLSCGYPRKAPLNMPFSGEITEPGIYAVSGPNGSGKSTLVKTWLGLLQPLSGTCKTLFHQGCRNNRTHSEIGYVPQSHSINPFFHITIQNFVAQGLGPSRDAQKAGASRVMPLLEEWDLLKDAQSSFHELSGGQKTRALVARAIVAEPHLVFLDEPLASLDGHCQDFLIKSFHEMALKKGVCVILIDHHFESYTKYFRSGFYFEKKHDRDISEISVRSF